MDSKISFSTSFFYELSIEELYIATTHWLSDLSFHELEINYFRSLIVRYYLPAAEESNSILIKSIEDDFHTLNFSKEDLKKSILQHQSLLGEFLDKSQTENEAHFNVIHSELKEKLFNFGKALRQLKLEFFNITK